MSPGESFPATSPHPSVECLEAVVGGGDPGPPAGPGLRGARRRPFVPITLKITLGVAALVVAISGTLILLGHSYSRSMLRQSRLESRLIHSASAYSDQLFHYVGHQEDRLALVAGGSGLGRLLDERAEGRIDAAAFRLRTASILDNARVSSTPRAGAARRGGGQFLDLWIADLSGVVIAATGEEAIGARIDRWPAFTEGRWRVHMDLPERLPSGFRSWLGGPIVTPAERRFVLLVALDLSPVVGLFYRQGGRSGVEILAGRRNGDEIQLFLPPEDELDRFRLSAAAAPALVSATGGRRELLATVDHRGRPVLAAAHPIGYGGWGLVVQAADLEDLAPLADLELLTIAVGALVLIVAIVASFVVARRLTRPVRRLTAAAGQVAAGNLAVEVEVERDDELGQLAAVFNRMVTQRRGYQDRLHAEVGARTAELAQANRELEEARRRAEELARTDALTGLANRRALRERLELMEAEASRGRRCAVALLDLDRFKGINDEHGHEVGDAVLRSVAATLRSRVRTIDLVARYGGEEFAVLLPGAGPAGAREVAERLRRAIESRPHAGLRVTASLGLAALDPPLRRAEAVMLAADAALYRAKELGRNRVVVGDEESPAEDPVLGALAMAPSRPYSKAG